MTEFGKHFSVLLVRNVLDDKVIAEAFSSINEARANKETRSGQPGADAVAADADRDFLQSQSPRSSQIRKSKGGCGVCHLPVMGPRLLICSNKVRDTPYTVLFEWHRLMDDFRNALIASIIRIALEKRPWRLWTVGNGCAANA
jgi:hypothetical protein